MDLKLIFGFGLRISAPVQNMLLLTSMESIRGGVILVKTVVPAGSFVENMGLVRYVWIQQVMSGVVRMMGIKYT